MKYLKKRTGYPDHGQDRASVGAYFDAQQAGGKG
jgi:hypothetical protein